MASLRTEPAAAAAGQIRRTPFFFAVAVWAGVCGGLLEGLLYNIFQEWRWMDWQQMLCAVGPDQIWVSAAFNLGIFTICAAGFSLAARIWPRAPWEVISLGGFLFLMLLPLMDLSGRIRLRGSGLLALGVAVQLTRMARPHLAALSMKAVRTAPVLLAGFALLVAGFNVVSKVREEQAVARLPAAQADAPNVLLIVWDTVRAQNLSSYGYVRATTPYLEQFAREAVLFERAYSTSSWTLPSHASMFTGLLPYQHGATGGAAWNGLDETHPTLGEALQEQGYVTAGFVANNMNGAPWQGLARGFQHYENLYDTPEDYFTRSYYGRKLYNIRHGKRLSSVPRLRRQAPSIRKSFLQWASANSGKPYFAFLNLMEAHEPYDPQPELAGKFQGAPSLPPEEDPVKIWGLGAEKARHRAELMEKYDTGILALDQELKRLVEEMAAHGLLKNTIVIVTSDHGELMGHHGLFEHGHALYEPLIRVPLVIRWPEKLPLGLRVAEPVSHRDLAATLLDLVEARGARLPGSSWRPLLGTRPDALGTGSVVVSEVTDANFANAPKDWPNRGGWLKAVIQRHRKTIFYESGDAELFDLVRDPREARNLSDTAEGEEAVEEVRALLKKAAPGILPEPKK